MLELMRTRRSTRKFTDEKVSEADVRKLLQAAQYAPTSMNKQPVELIICDDTADIRRIKECKNKGVFALDSATLAVLVIADADKSDIWQEDAAIAATQLMLEAEALGLGCCWIQLRNRTAADDCTPSEQAARTMFGIPEKYGVLAVMALGHKDEQHPPYPADALDEAKIHRNRF